MTLCSPVLLLVVNHVFAVELLGCVTDADPELGSGSAGAFRWLGEDWPSGGGDRDGAKLAALSGVESDADCLSGDDGQGGVQELPQVQFISVGIAFGAE